MLQCLYKQLVRVLIFCTSKRKSVYGQFVLLCSNSLLSRDRLMHDLLSYVAEEFSQDEAHLQQVKAETIF